jgi:hypothetical protein
LGQKSRERVEALEPSEIGSTVTALRDSGFISGSFCFVPAKILRIIPLTNTFPYDTLTPMVHYSSVGGSRVMRKQQTLKMCPLLLFGRANYPSFTRSVFSETPE